MNDMLYIISKGYFTPILTIKELSKIHGIGGHYFYKYAKEAEKNRNMDEVKGFKIKSTNQIYSPKGFGKIKYAITRELYEKTIEKIKKVYVIKSTELLQERINKTMELFDYGDSKIQWMNDKIIEEGFSAFYFEDEFFKEERLEHEYKNKLVIVSETSMEYIKKNLLKGNFSKHPSLTLPKKEIKEKIDGLDVETLYDDIEKAKQKHKEQVQNYKYDLKKDLVEIKDSIKMMEKSILYTTTNKIKIAMEKLIDHIKPLHESIAMNDKALCGDGVKEEAVTENAFTEDSDDAEKKEIIGNILRRHVNREIGSICELKNLTEKVVFIKFYNAFFDMYKDHIKRPTKEETKSYRSTLKYIERNELLEELIWFLENYKKELTNAKF